MRYNNKDTIVAISTPIGEGGIGIVRLSGKKALAIADKVFVSKDGRRPSNCKTYTVHYGHIVHRQASSKSHCLQNLKKDGGAIDEVILTVMLAPKSYTREDVVEINCHGGIVPLRQVLDEVVKLGVRPAEPGEFTKRAFLNGRIDLAQAEAVCDIISAKTDASLKVALTHLEGDFSKEITRERDRLLDILKDLEAEIDFSEDIETDSREDLLLRLGMVMNNLQKVLDTQDAGMLLKEGITCVICGKTNVGKSSLLNSLLRRNRAIVTHVPGTTRDIIEETVAIKGVAVKLVDTAGIVNSRNIVEREGVKQSKNYLKKADLIIFMLDLSKLFSEEDRAIIRLLPVDKTIVAANKSDLKQRLDLEKIKPFTDKRATKISVLRKRNINIIENLIAEKIWTGGVMPPEPTFLTNVRHKKALQTALKTLKSAAAVLKKGLPLELAAVDVRESISRLGLITGQSVDIKILDRIFEKFCIGK